VRALLASPLAILIGWSLGALGGGGSILALPVLVYAAGQEPTSATATSMILVALSSAIALVPHARARRVRLRAGLVFAVSGIPAALLGGWLAHDLDPDLLLLLFTPVMAAAALSMLRSHQAPRASEPRSWPVPGCVVVGIVGLGVGLLTGVFGVGGGFVIVPALVLALNVPMPEAVGTSLLVIMVNSLVALSTRLHADTVEWGVVVPFVLAAMIGVAIGSRTADRVPADRLRRGFAWLLLAVATFSATRSGLALAA
jgi:uncharacterized membrane protein YfcA